MSVCTTCDGTGFVEIHYPEDSTVDYFDCDACYGAGYVESEDDAS